MRIRRSDEKSRAHQSQQPNLSLSTSLRVSGLLLLLTVVFSSGILFHKLGYVNRTMVWIKDTRNQWVNDIQNEIKGESSLYSSNGLPTLQLDIPFESLQSIEEKRKEALQTGILLTSDEDYVPASLRFGNQDPLDIKMRLKGDWADHFETDKWSFRIHIQDDNGNVFGMRRFSLQAPETRTFVDEWALHQLYLKEGILTTRYDFVNVVMNGENKGIFALEESFSTELIESQERREGILLRLNEDMLWGNRANNPNEDLDTPTFLITDPNTAAISIYREGHVIDSTVLSAEASKAVNMLSAFHAGNVQVEDVFDVALWGKYFALTSLWGGNHGAFWHNIRYYYNPITGLIEPVGFDAQPGEGEISSLEIIFEDLTIFNNPLIREAYGIELNRIATKDFVEETRQELEANYDHYFGALQQEYGEALPQLSPWDYLSLNSDIIRANLQPASPLYGNYKFLPYTDGGFALQVNLFNSFLFPLELIEVAVNETTVDISSAAPSQNTKLARWEPYPLLNYYSEGFITPDRLNFPTDYLVEPLPDDVVITAKVLMAGFEDEQSPYTITLKPEWSDFQIATTSRPPQPTLDALLGELPFLQLSQDEKTLYTLSGEWHVKNDLVVAPGYSLDISPGTTLLFEEGAVLFNEGAPIHIKGTEELPVRLDAQDNSWGGVVVLNSSEPSIWNWAIVENTASVSRDSWILTGGITFYQSPILIYQSFLSTADAEDAINVISTDFVFEKTMFAATPFDAFDGDFTTGEINHCSFTNIRGDAIDVSGSQIKVFDITIKNVADKGISAGERSFVEVDIFNIEEVGIGIASKDSSEVYLRQGFISNARVAGLAAYIKKPIFGPAFIQADNVSIDTEPDSICQIDSTILREGNRATQQELDVSLLYSLGILGN
jgi:hypothetical protein